MTPRGLRKATHAIGKTYAWLDWRRAADYAEQQHRGDLVLKHQPPENAGMRSIDKHTKALMDELGITGSEIGLAAGDL